MEELGHDQVRHLVVDGRAEEHDAFLQQARVDVEGPLAAVRLLDDDWDQVVLEIAHALVSPCSSEEGPMALLASAASVSSLSGCSTSTTSAFSTRRSSALDLMISPASCTTAPD